MSLFAIIVLFVWISFFPAPLQQEYQLILNISLLLSFGVVLIKKTRNIFRLSDTPLWFFLLAIGVNIFFAQQKHIASMTYLNLAVPMFLIYYIAANAFLSDTHFNLLAKVICVCSILVALLGVFEAIFAVNPIYQDFIDNPYYKRYICYFVRPMSTQYCPAPLGTYLLGCLPFSYFLFRQDRSKVFRFLGVLGIVFGAVVLILTFSRGVFLGLIGMILFYFIAQKKFYSVVWIFIILLMLISLCSFMPYPFDRFGFDRFIMSSDGVISNYRFDRCSMVQRIVTEHPLSGIGFTQIRDRFFEYYHGDPYVPYEFRIADNMYLTMLAETGIIGFAGFLIFILSVLVKGIKRLKALKNIPKERFHLLMVLSAFFGFLVNMGAYELFYWQNQYLFFCILVGLIEAFWRMGRINES